ncbi:MAG: cysteine-rich small domain-containing protein [Lachnospiraceae bacterium]|nr:cysteine-rich small domain-containing protein [Lachnospiraceae bacterium]
MTEKKDQAHRYFENRECKYYPCHKGLDDINCLFCYCPLYFMRDCPGKPVFTEKNGKLKKVCTGCTYPHEAGNYETILKTIKEYRYWE